MRTFKHYPMKHVTINSVYIGHANIKILVQIKNVIIKNMLLLDYIENTKNTQN